MNKSTLNFIAGDPPATYRYGRSSPSTNSNDEDARTAASEAIQGNAAEAAATTPQAAAPALHPFHDAAFHAASARDSTDYEPHAHRQR